VTARRGLAAAADALRPVEWLGDRIRYLDQTKLPGREVFVDARDVSDVADAIRRLAVRGAPLLGIVAGYGLALAAVRSRAARPQGLRRDVRRAGRTLVESRPTAVNIAWGVDRVLAVAGNAPRGGETAEALRSAVVAEAQRIDADERAACDAIGRFGAELIPKGSNVLTHCNTGSLATGWEGTAQAVITSAWQAGRCMHVWVDETRPLLQGARLTAWELGRLGIPLTLVVDGAAGSLMAGGRVQAVVVGADRIAANGDVTNKVGTYSLAVLARHHRIPFIVAAPSSTVDPATPSGAEIRIEERDGSEVTFPFGVALAPPGTVAANPAFDVTPAGLVSAIVTERGVVRPASAAGLRRVVGQADGPGPRARAVGA
jgi:methylthioribose-1-phosphate isomerase